MPCRDYEEDNRYELSKDFARLEKRNNLLAGMLCAILKKVEFEAGETAAQEMLTELRDGKEHVYSVKDALAWWEGHKKADAERKIADARAIKEKKRKADALIQSELKQLEELAKKHGKKLV